MSRRAQKAPAAPTAEELTSAPSGLATCPACGMVSAGVDGLCTYCDADMTQHADDTAGDWMDAADAEYATLAIAESDMLERAGTWEGARL